MGRYRNEAGSIVNVDDELADLIGKSWKRLDGTQDVPEGKPDESWKVPELKAYAAEHDIDLGDAKKKDEILAAIAGVDGTPSTSVSADGPSPD